MLFGASTPFSKLLLGSVNPWLLAGILYLGAGIGLSIFLLIERRHLRRAHGISARLRDLPWLAAVVVAGGIAGPVLLMFGLSTTDASSASLLLNLEGVATMAIAWIVFRENVDRRLLLGAAAILAGAVLLSWSGEGFSLGWGSILIAGACLAWGIDNNLTRKLSASDPVQIAAVKGLVAGAVNTGVGDLPRRAGDLARTGGGGSSRLASSGLGSASCSSCWGFATSERRGQVHISRWRPSSARHCRSSC